MARVQRFSRITTWVEATKGWNGISYVAWKPSSSRWFGDRKSLLKWLGWPIKTPTGDELRAWLDEVEQTKAEPEQALPEPQEATKTII